MLHTPERLLIGYWIILLNYIFRAHLTRYVQRAMDASEMIRMSKVIEFN